MSQSSVVVTLIKSPHHRRPEHRATLRALGLRKIGATRTHTVTPVIQGMIRKVGYMLKVEGSTK